MVPPATAQAVTARPVASAALTVTLALLATWLGLAVSYFTDYPIGFTITTIAFAGYVAVAAARWVGPGRLAGRGVG